MAKSKELREYLKAREKAAYWKKQEEAFRPGAMADLWANDYSDVFITRSSDKRKLIPSKFLEFLQDVVPPAVLWDYTIEVLDTSRVDELFERGYFDPLDLPPWVYETKPGAERIEIPANRKRKKDG